MSDMSYDQKLQTIMDALEQGQAAIIAQNMWADMLEDKDVRRMRQRNQWLLDAISQAIRKGGKE